MAVKFGDVLYINSISNNEIGEDVYHTFNLSIRRIACTGYMSRQHDGYVYIIYDGQLLERDGIFFYLSNWKYEDIGSQSAIQSARWVKSEPYVLETSPREAYPMTKSLLQMFISEKVGIKLQINKEDNVVNIEFTETAKYVELLKKFADNECEVATEILNCLLAASKEHINIVY